MNFNQILDLYNDCYMVCDIQNGKVLELYPTFPNVNLPCNILNILRHKQFQLDINALRDIDHFLSVANENDCLNVRCKDTWYCLELKRGPNKEEILHLYNLKTAMNMIVEDMAKTKTDPLTKILERDAIRIYVDSFLHDHNTATPTMFLLDIDFFKNINDIYGHYFGDRVIKAVAEELTSLCGSSGKVGRVGGDKFVLFVNHDLDRLGIKNVARLIRYVLENLEIDGKKFSICTTIGISQYPKDGKKYDELYEKCDKALYRGKCKGRDCHIIYDSTLHENIKNEEIKENVESVGGLMATEFVNQVLKTITSLDYDSSTNEVFELIADYFKLDRIVSMEFDGLVEIRYSTTTDYSGAIKYQSLNLDEYLNNFVDDIFFVNDTTTWKKKNMDIYNIFHDVKVASFVQIILRNENDDAFGILSFESQNSRRVWQKGEINYLAIIAKIINNFYDR